MTPAALEARTQAIGRELFERARGETPGVSFVTLRRRRAGA